MKDEGLKSSSAFILHPFRPSGVPAYRGSAGAVK
jgi:hypothetical protein